MRQALCAAASVLMLLAGTASGYAEESTGTWWSRMFRKPATTEKQSAPAAKDGRAAPSATPSGAEQRQAKAREDWIRRQQVCDQLRQAAYDSGDDDLLRQIDQLDQRAWELYAQRTGTPLNHEQAEEAMRLRLSTDAGEVRNRLTQTPVVPTNTGRASLRGTP